MLKYCVLNRSGSLYTVLSMPGAIGLFCTKYPPSPTLTGFPVSSKISCVVPGKLLPATVGIKGPMPGKALIKVAPVSVCHHVSTTGHLSPPMTLKYHSQASWLIGSPTVPRRRRLLKSCFLGHSSPHFKIILIAVGAV